MVVRFKDHPEFTPDFSPKEMFKMGIMGSFYFRPIYSSIAKKNIKDAYKEFKFLKGIPLNKICNPVYDKNINKYKVKCGLSLEYWEKHHFIRAPDYYGWIHWYCRFYQGRRSKDDAWQIKRWQSFKNRFGKRKVKTPVIKQTLLNWGIDWSKV
jgi:hypothetical protein